jgi:ribosomal protein L10
LDEYPKVFIVGADNVGSRQMQKIRLSLRGHAGKEEKCCSNRMFFCLL